MKGILGRVGLSRTYQYLVTSYHEVLKGMGKIVPVLFISWKWLFCYQQHFVFQDYFADTIDVYVDSHSCYNCVSDAVVQWIVQVPQNAMVMSWNLGWQCTYAKAVYTGGRPGMGMFGVVYVGRECTAWAVLTRGGSFSIHH